MLRWIWAGLLAAVMLSSCIEGKVDITVNRDLSGTVNVDLLVAGESRYVSSDLSSLNYQFIPLTGNAVSDIVNGNPGLKLVSYSETPEGENVSVKYRVDAEKISSAGLLSGYGDGIKTLSIDFPEKGKVRIVLRNPVRDKMSVKTRNLLSSLYKDKTVVLSVKVPGFITSTDIGELSEDPSVAVLRIKVTEFMNSREDRIWNLVYTPGNGG